MHTAFAERGEAADLLYNIARYEEAETAYHDLYRDLVAAGPVDLFLAGKIALGLLLTYIESGQVQRAHALWISAPRDPLGEGVWAIEHGVLSRRDLASYQTLSALLHSLSATDPDAAVEAVNVHMQAVCDFARADDPPLLPVSIQNWKQALTNLQALDRPGLAGAALRAEEARWGSDLPADGIDFPPPDAWKRP